MTHQTCTTKFIVAAPGEFTGGLWAPVWGECPLREGEEALYYWGLKRPPAEEWRLAELARTEDPARVRVTATRPTEGEEVSPVDYVEGLGFFAGHMPEGNPWDDDPDWD